MYKSEKKKLIWALALTVVGLAIFSSWFWPSIEIAVQSVARRNSTLIRDTSPQQLNRAQVALRVKHLRDIGEGEYKVAEAQVLEVFKNISGERIGDTVKIASSYGKQGLPAEAISTVYLEPYNPKDGLWMLLGGSQFSGASHTSYVAGELIEPKAPVPTPALLDEAAIRCDPAVGISSGDRALENTYKALKDKGKIIYGTRMTIWTPKQEYKVGERVKVFHAIESVRDGVMLSLGGTGTICTEYVDDKLVDNRKCHGSGSRSVSEPVAIHPYTIFNFDISNYCFRDPGEHTIRLKSHWKGESNLIKIQVKAK